MAIVLAGWLPLTIGHTLAEGHNDIVITFFLLLWMYSKNLTALTAAFLNKYLVAPLFLLAPLDRPSKRQIILSFCLAVAMFSIYYRGPGFFAGAQEMIDWRFLSPRVAIDFLGPFSWLAVLPFWIVAAKSSWTFWSRRDGDARIKAAIAILAVVMFALLPLVWPWYVVQILLPAAFVPMWGLSIWVTGVALAAPFSALYIFRGADLPDYVPALVYYAFACSWLLVILGIRAAAKAGKFSRIRGC